MTLELDLSYLAIVGVLALRFSVLLALMPLLDHRAVPIVWRVGLAATLALAVAPVVAAELGDRQLAVGWGTALVEVARSVLVGMLLALSVGMVFAGVKYAGQIAGMQIGFAIVNTVDPQSGRQHSILSQVAGVPLGYFGLAVGLLVSLGALFPTVDFERTNRSIALLNVIGVVVLFLVSVFILKSLCLYCSGFYGCTGYLYPQFFWFQKRCRFRAGKTSNPLNKSKKYS